jgi:DNA-binding response OmpR family regulator
MKEGVMRVLVVEDHAALARAVALRLRRERMAVDLAVDGAEALDKAELNRYDVIVLDRDLPRVHGDEVCRRLVAKEHAPRILMLTAARGVDDVVGGLQLGADDYLAKPFAMAELVARIRSLARRPDSVASPVLTVGDLVVDVNRQTVTRNGRPLALSPKEFAVLEVFAATPGSVVSAEELLEKVWDEYTDPFTNAVRVTMVTLRRKLGEPGLISTVKGRGYRLAAEEEA